MRMIMIAMAVLVMTACGKSGDDTKGGGDDKTGSATAPASSGGDDKTGSATAPASSGGDKEDMARAAAASANERERARERAMVERDAERLEMEIAEMLTLIDEAQEQLGAAMEAQDVDGQKAAQAKLQHLREQYKTKRARTNHDNKAAGGASTAP